MSAEIDEAALVRAILMADSSCIGSLPKSWTLSRAAATRMEQLDKAEAENAALRSLLKECKKVMKANALFRGTITAHDLCKRISTAIYAAKEQQ